MSFPSSDHCDGTFFFNPPLPDDWTPAPRPPAWPDDPPSELSAEKRRRGVRPSSFLRWIVESITEKQPHIVDPPAAGHPTDRPEANRVGVTFIGHCTFLLRLQQPDGRVLTILTDPIFSERCSPVSFFGPKRFRPPAWRLEDLPPIDIVLISHSHYDHLDLPSLRAIARRDNPVVVTPFGNCEVIRKSGLHRIAERDWWESVRIGDLEITCTPARHFSQRTLKDAGRRLWGGFFLRFPNAPAFPSVFFAGDTAHSPHWKQIHDRLGAPDVALLPIGAYAPRSFLRKVHVDPVEAVAAFQQLDAKQAIAMHFGTFPLSKEPLGEPERCLRETLDWAGLPADVFVPLAFGETRSVGGVNPSHAQADRVEGGEPASASPPLEVKKKGKAA
ncbi:MBL fold metallo-hydrolase [Acetobacter sp.]|uniref:MBL fold metallo-hydrolase n=1 Tax=Acetobacter sp. TaxID=440 RepID=UPI0039E8D920